MIDLRHIYETAFTLWRATGLTSQCHQLLRPPENDVPNYERNLPKKTAEVSFDSTMIRTWTGRLAPVRSSRLFLALWRFIFVRKNTTFRTPAIYLNFTKHLNIVPATKLTLQHRQIAPATTSNIATSSNVALATKSGIPASPNVGLATKSNTPTSPNCTCHEKQHCNITKCCPCYQKWHSNITQMLRLPRKVTLQHQQILCLSRVRCEWCEWWVVGDVIDVWCERCEWRVSYPTLSYRTLTKLPEVACSEVFYSELPELPCSEFLYSELHWLLWF